MTSHPLSFMFVFPGQGSQYRGMGEDLCSEFLAAKGIYERASAVVGYDLAELSFRDPEGKLDLTAFTQPALLTHSIACLEAFRALTDGRIEPTIVAGHSLGEYSAMVAAGVLSFEDALRLVKRRGELMSEHGRGQMLALPMTLEMASAYAERHFCGIGGCNLPNQTVVGGLEDDLERLQADLKVEQPSVRATRLRTEGAFHTYLMVDAAIAFRKELEATEFKAPSCRILSNYTGDFHDTEPVSFRNRLFYQLFNPVRWARCVQVALEERVGAMIEFGGGVGGDTPAQKRPNLAAILKRVAKAHKGRYGRRASDTDALDYEPVYAAAINAGTIPQAAHLASAMRQIKTATAAQRAVNGGARPHTRLIVPTQGGVPLDQAVAPMQRIAELGLAAKVDIVAEDTNANTAFLAQQDPPRKGPAAYLEVIADGGDSSVYHFDKDVDEQLHALSGSASN